MDINVSAVAPPANLNLIIYQGDTFERSYTFKLDNVALNLSAYAVEAQMRRGFGNEDAVSFTIDDTSGATGVIGLSLSHDDTTDLVPGDYVWDLQRATVTVIPGGLENTQDEQQAIDIGEPTAGTWTISFTDSGVTPTTQTTAAIQWDASAVDVQAALEALSNIGAGNVSVIDGGQEYDFYVYFINALGATDHNLLEVNVSLLTGVEDAQVETIQQGGESYYPDEVEYSNVLTLVAGTVTVVPEVTRQ